MIFFRHWLVGVKIVGTLNEIFRREKNAGIKKMLGKKF